MTPDLKFAIIADDLTGACDCGVQLFHAGYCTVVHFGPGLPSLPGSASALVVDTESRLLAASEAEERAVEVGRTVKSARILYKKIDSALRGPFCAELTGMLEATGRKKAIIAPAFPSQGRTTTGGVQRIFGTPVAQAQAVQDLLTPVNQSHLPTLLEEAGFDQVAAFSVQDLEMKGRLQTALQSANWVVVDAETDAHLNLLVREIDRPEEILWVGSAGLSAALGKCYPGPGCPADRSLFNPALRTLAVIGSISQVAQDQIETAGRQEGIRLVPLLLPENEDYSGEIHKAVQAAGQALKTGQAVIIYPAFNARQKVQASSLTRKKGQEISFALAEAAALLSEGDLFDALVLSGGETAVHVAQRLGNWGISLAGEVEPGVPAGRFLGPKPYHVITKAGSFGTNDTLSHCLAFLTTSGGI